MAREFDQEYAQVCLTLRHYSALRFGTRTLFLAVSIGLAVIALGILPQQTLLAKTVAKACGLLVTGFFWVSEKNAARYMAHFQERAARLEKDLGYRLWSGMPGSSYGVVGPAFLVPLVYAGIAVFWTVALIALR